MTAKAYREDRVHEKSGARERERERKRRQGGEEPAERHPSSGSRVSDDDCSDSQSFQGKGNQRLSGGRREQWAGMSRKTPAHDEGQRLGGERCSTRRCRPTSGGSPIAGLRADRGIVSCLPDFAERLDFLPSALILPPLPLQQKSDSPPAANASNLNLYARPRVLTREPSSRVRGDVGVAGRKSSRSQGKRGAEVRFSRSHGLKIRGRKMLARSKFSCRANKCTRIESASE